MRRVLAVFVLGCTLLAGPAMIFGSQPVVITAEDLLKAATDNPSAAEAQYLNKTVQVKGIVVSKGISRYLTPNVVLSNREGGPELVICVLPRLDTAKLSDFEPGQSVTFSGRVHRLSAQRVIMKECKAATNN